MVQQRPPQVIGPISCRQGGMESRWHTPNISRPRIRYSQLCIPTTRSGRSQPDLIWSHNTGRSGLSTLPPSGLNQRSVHKLDSPAGLPPPQRRLPRNSEGGFPLKLGGPAGCPLVCNRGRCGPAAAISGCRRQSGRGRSAWAGACKALHVSPIPTAASNRFGGYPGHALHAPGSPTMMARDAYGERPRRSFGPS